VRRLLDGCEIDILAMLVCPLTKQSTKYILLTQTAKFVRPCSTINSAVTNGININM